MKILILAGLVSYDKAALAEDMARRLAATGQSVTLIDNSEYTAVSAVNGVTVIRVEKSTGAAAATAGTHSDVILITASEALSPDGLLALQDEVQTVHPAAVVRQIALVDDRTCDCFPHLREAFDAQADLVLHAPFDLEKALAL